MKKITLVLMLFVAGIVSSQTKYEKKMQKAFQLWEKGEAVKAAKLFEKISKSESENWIPPYYAAQIYITESFKERDEKALGERLGKAQKLLDKASKVSKNNAELLVMQAMLHTAWVVYDGEVYGPKLSGVVYELYGKAMRIAPRNPRVVLEKAQWDIGFASYFEKDATPFYKDIERSIELFAKFEESTVFYPKWGKEHALQILENRK